LSRNAFVASRLSIAMCCFPRVATKPRDLRQPGAVLGGASAPGAMGVVQVAPM
jgi:hypothetical protein